MHILVTGADPAASRDARKAAVERAAAICTQRRPRPRHSFLTAVADAKWMRGHGGLDGGG